MLVPLIIYSTARKLFTGGVKSFSSNLKWEDPSVLGKRQSAANVNLILNSSIYFILNLFSEFIAAVRNLLEPVRPYQQVFWTKENCELSLESDSFALEYLASFDYDTEKALFNIFCDLGCGKSKKRCEMECVHIIFFSFSYNFSEKCSHVIFIKHIYLSTYDRSYFLFRLAFLTFSRKYIFLNFFLCIILILYNPVNHLIFIIDVMS